MIELDHPLSHVERVVIRQRNDAGSEFDSVGSLRGGGEEHLWAGDHFPAGGMVLATPKLVESEAIEMLSEVKISTE